jgi:iron complex transport system ATP-binding protein
MSDGRVVADGAPSDVLRAETIEEIYRVRVRVLPHPGTGRPVVVPDASAPALYAVGEGTQP